MAFPVWMLRQPGFDLNKSMGTTLRSKCDFVRRRGAKDAYVRIFRESKAQMESIFEDEGLVLLAGIRNLLVHKVGKFDAEFQKIAKNHPTLSKPKIGERILLDGDLVKALVTASVSQSKALLDFVDGWLSSNPS